MNRMSRRNRGKREKDDQNKEHSISTVELELRLLQALENYHLKRLAGIHSHFVLYGLMETLRRSTGQNFSPEEVLKLLDRFYNLEFVPPHEDDIELLNREQEFCLPSGFFLTEES